MKSAEKDIKKAQRIQSGGKALFLDTDSAAKVSIFAEFQSGFTQNIQVERGHIFTSPRAILVKDITPELEHRKSGYVERKRRPYQGNVVRIA